MSRLLLPVLALALLVPTAAAQGVSPSATLSLSGLAGTHTSNETTAVIPTHVTLSLSNLVCTSSSDSTFTVTIAATGTGVEAKPSSLAFKVPAGVSSLQGFSQSLDTLVYVRHSGDLSEAASANGDLTATLPAGAGGCTGADGSGTPGATAHSNFTVQFTAPQGVASTKTQTQPAPGLAILAVAVVALAVAVRRFK